MPSRRTVFFLSDRTGITAEMLGNSLLSQFEDFQFQRHTVPFVDSSEKIDAVIRQINENAAAEDRARRQNRDHTGSTPAGSGGRSPRSSQLSPGPW